MGLGIVDTIINCPSPSDAGPEVPFLIGAHAVGETRRHVGKDIPSSEKPTNNYVEYPHVSRPIRVVGGANSSRQWVCSRLDPEPNKVSQEIPVSLIDKSVDKRANMSLAHNERIGPL